MANGGTARHTSAKRHTSDRSAATTRNQTFEAPVPDPAQSTQVLMSERHHRSLIVQIAFPQ